MVEKEIPGIVVLNYCNYHETIRCISSIKNILRKPHPIVIVDNGSLNDSFNVLCGRYKSDRQITVVKAQKNLGFAKGNNIGIYVLRKFFQCNYILLLNSDTIMVDPDYIEKLCRCYHSGIGVVEADVWDRKGIFVQLKNFSPTILNCIRLFVKDVCHFYHIACSVRPGDNEKGSYPIQVGCSILLTPDYFCEYSGLYGKTFLYGEEEILVLLLKRANLKLAFCNKTYIVHNEGGSTEGESLNGTRKKEKRFIRADINILRAAFSSYSKLKKAAKGADEDDYIICSDSWHFDRNVD